MKKIYYWSPCLEKVGTYKSTINSAISLAKYSNNLYSIKIINICGEWDEEEKKLNRYGIDLINLNFKYFKFLPKTGFFKSRFSYILIFILSIVPLIFFLKKHKPQLLVVHLLTSLPFFLKLFFNYKTKLILRVSGFPKLNIIRRYFWKMVSSKVKWILCPTKELSNQLKALKEFSDEKIEYLPDPIITRDELLTKRKSSDVGFCDNANKKFISAGRLTRQKNYNYLILEFKEYLKINPEATLTIFGNGENKNKIISKIKKLNLNDNIFIRGYVNNLYYYMKKADAFILSSLWEDPGHVIIESAMNNLFIISSDCKNGPSEFLENGKGGILFSSNTKDAIKNSLIDFDCMKDMEKKKRKFVAKKKSLNFTLFRHYKKFINIIEN
jgi:glycosyltransferase involved in cell wall biosynthesis